MTKEDIQVRFYEEKDGQVVWEGLGEFQPSQVHKQTAICFKPPKYRTLDIWEPVKVNIQLRRPSDGETSVPVPFQFLPLNAGRPAYWSLRHPSAKKRNYDIFSELLTRNALLQSKQPSFLTSLGSNIKKFMSVHTQTEATVTTNNVNLDDDEEVLSELVDQVVELDRIYAESKCFESVDERQTCSFDDTKSYTSLQMALKNPVEMNEEKDKYEDVIIIPESPMVDVTSENPTEEVEKLPPLPPKRIKRAQDGVQIISSASKIITDISNPTMNDSNSSLQITNANMLGIALNDVTASTSNPNMSLVEQHHFKMQRPKSHGDLCAPTKHLPPTPSSTLPKPKKSKLLSGLFSYLNKSSKDNVSSKRNSFSSSKSLQVNPVNRSSSNVSHQSVTTSIRIPLKNISVEEDDLNQNCTPNQDVNLLHDNLDFNLDLTEAEHYALYTAIAPHATQSEFDEASCYYAPVEGGKIMDEFDMHLKLESNKT